MNVKEIVDKVYPQIAKDYKCSAKVELYSDIYTSLDVIPAIDEYEICAEYSWSYNKIYLYTNYLKSEEDVIKALIHECVHSNQCYEVFQAYYNECDLDYDTNPFEIEAEYEEENWKKYKQNTNCVG